MNQNTKTATATFQVDGESDHVVRVVIDDDNGVGMSIDIGDDDGAYIVEFPTQAGRLQLAEALRMGLIFGVVEGITPIMARTSSNRSYSMHVEATRYPIP